MMWIIIGIVVVIGFMMVKGMVNFKNDVNQTEPEYMIQLIKDKAEDENIALSVLYNGQNWLDINENILLPLASTVKIIIAIEYARQIEKNIIDPKQKVPLTEIEKYNISKTDGNAYQKWKKSLNLTTESNGVTLDEIAQGMIYYSSNANTDFLIQVLGIDNINEVPKLLGIEDHEPIFPIVSSLYIPVQLMRDKKLTKQQTIIAVRDMEAKEFRKMAIDIHERWMKQPPTPIEKNRIAKNLNMAIQRAWSGHLPRSTTKAYATIMSKLNSKTYFSEEVHNYLDPLLERSMERPEYIDRYIHLGRSAGFTTSSVTLALYATDKMDNEISLALFANELNPIQQMKMTHTLNEFQQNFLNDPSFRDLIKNELLIEEAE